MRIHRLVGCLLLLSAAACRPFTHAPTTYTHVIDVDGALPTGGAQCVKPHIVLAAPDSTAWRAVTVVSVGVLPVECLPEEVDNQDDTIGGDR